jgi:hypothetical protein
LCIYNFVSEFCCCEQRAAHPCHPLQPGCRSP